MNKEKFEKFGYYIREIYSISMYIQQTSKLNDIQYSEVASQLFYSKPQFTNYDDFKLVHYHNTNDYIANLSNVDIITGSNLILPVDSNYALTGYYDFFSNGYFFMDKGKSYQKNKMILIKGKVKRTNYIDSGILLTGNHSKNYYHFIFEFITKFYLIKKMKLSPSIPLLLDESCSKINQYKEL
ncbi:MAG: hypothetical protein KDC67_04240, partial [Ignavibacteriae bacterium]|nr:hypothetical protein [Ignavibacteriota bacterium]